MNHAALSLRIGNLAGGKVMENTMKTVQIPRAEWTGFFDELSKKLEGKSVALEVFGPEIGDQVEERQMFFAGLTADVTDKAGKQDQIEIMLGGNPRAHLTHLITAPIEVDLQQTEFGVASVLQIKAADGTTSLLRLG
jgi:hypothetical protein